MGKYFGTDGFRGEANVVLTYDHAIKIGRFLGWYYGARIGKKAKIVIGKDTRRSSYMFEYALCTGLMASGADAYIMHVTTTPSVSYITRTDDFDCGIMISASHNPYYDNGIKLMNYNGEKMDEATILEVEKYIDGEIPEIPMAKDSDIGRTGAAWTIAKAVFDALGAKTYVMNNDPDGFNINTDCGSTHIEHLQKFVKDNNLDVGFAYDGDADRCLCVDEKGNVVTGDHILYIYGRYMKERGKLLNNKVVTTVMSNFGLYKALDKVGIDYEKTKVGDKYVYENMVTYGNRIGGEQSGHIIFSKYATTGDGILTSMKIMEVMLAKDKRREGREGAGKRWKDPRSRVRNRTGDPSHGRSGQHRDLREVCRLCDRRDHGERPSGINKTIRRFSNESSYSGKLRQHEQVDSQLYCG